MRWEGKMRWHEMRWEVEIKCDGMSSRDKKMRSGDKIRWKMRWEKARK